MWLKKIRVSIFILLFLLSSGVIAKTSPVVTLEKVADQMLTYLHQNQSELRNPKVIYRIVNVVLIPYVDMERMAGSVVGRQYWQEATPAQRQTFIKEFEYLVVSTYSAALSSYNNDTIRFYPLRDNTDSHHVVKVDSVIVRKNGQRIPISYNLVLRGDRWKVYDFSIEGVSMVQSYHSQFAGVLAQGGMPALLQRLIAHNRGNRVR